MAVSVGTWATGFTLLSGSVRAVMEGECMSGATVPSPAPLSGLSQSLPQSFQTSQDCGNALSTHTFAALPATFVCYYKSHIRHSQTPRGQTTAICPPMILLDTSRITQSVNGQGRHLCVAWQAGGGSVPCGTYLRCPPLSEIPV